MATPRQVVIVDDEPQVLAVLQRLLASWGYDTVPFSQFDEARHYLADHRPHALVVDVRLGEFNGLQLVHLAKQTNPDIIVAVVSGFNDPVLRAEAAAAGAAYLLKPSELSELQRILAAAS